MWVAWVAKLSLFATTTIASSGRNCIIYPNSWPHWFCRSTRSSDKKSSLAPTNIHLLFFLSVSLSLTTILVKVVLVRRNHGSFQAVPLVLLESFRPGWSIIGCNFLTSYIGNWMHFCSIKSFWNLKDSHIDIAIDQRFEAFLVKVGRCWEAISHHMLCVWKPSSSLFYVVVRWAGKRRRRRRPVAQLAHS